MPSIAGNLKPFGRPVAEFTFKSRLTQKKKHSQNSLITCSVVAIVVVGRLKLVLLLRFNHVVIRDDRGRFLRLFVSVIVAKLFAC